MSLDFVSGYAVFQFLMINQISDFKDGSVC
jgi:hypothetical protein